jgi:ubiquinol oxidase
VILVVRADEARHRDVNHMFSDDLAGHPEGGVIGVYPEHAAEILDLS